MFRRKNDEGVVTPKMLMDENQKLKNENKRLRESADNVKRLKEEYESLIADLKNIRKKYLDKLVEVDMLVKSYENSLEKMLG